LPELVDENPDRCDLAIDAIRATCDISRQRGGIVGGLKEKWRRNCPPYIADGIAHDELGPTLARSDQFFSFPHGSDPLALARFGAMALEPL
jgi:hypothetical protein